MVPYKKVSFLPAYFYKVFIKKKKAEPEDPKKKPKIQKPDPKLKPGQKAPDSKEQDADVISVKTKKLMSQMKQD